MSENRKAPLPKFIQISTLTSFAAVLLNRDDSGLAKRMPYGGFVRTRISSQCLKRHWRIEDDEYSLTKAGEGLSLAVRSRETFKRRLADPLKAEGFAEDVVNTVLAAFQKDIFGKKEKAGQEGTADQEDEAPAKPGKKAAKSKKNEDPNIRGEVVVLGEAEIAFMLKLAREVVAEAGGDAKAAEKKSEKLLKSRIDQLKAMKCGAGVDAAMFGRFLSGEPAARVTSAVHVAHALTVHEETSETDYFSAVDDLTITENAGSGHLGATELTSGLFYNYAVIDVPGLVANLGASAPKDWLTADRTVAARLVRNLVHLICAVSPGAKLGSTAPFSRAGFILVEAGERQPRSLAEAFLDPIPLRQPDLFGRTIKRLTSHVTSLDGMYGPHETRLYSSREGEEKFADAKLLTVPKLAEELERMILNGKAVI